MKKDRYGRKVPMDPGHDKPMARFAETIDQEALSSFLDTSGNDRYETLMILMQDPAYAGLKFATLCKKANVTLHEMQEIYANGMRQVALLRMSNALPDLMADVAEDARTRQETCPRCDGFGFIPYKEVTRECPMCHGKLTVRRVGDKQARELVFESAKMIRQSGPMVAIQQNFNSGDSHLESILNKTRSIVLDKPTAIDVPSSGEVQNP
jgi:hypothetical protein